MTYTFNESRLRQNTDTEQLLILINTVIRQPS